MNAMFQTCYSLQSVPLFNTASVTNMGSMFYNCNSLQSVPLFNTASVTNMGSMFFNCHSIKEIPAFDCAAVTTGNFSNTFYACLSLASIKILNPKFSFSVAGCALSAAALNEIYGNLFNTTGQTITVTSNYGTTGDDPTIATAKNWTVSG
jgi:surface protein